MNKKQVYTRAAVIIVAVFAVAYISVVILSPGDYSDERPTPSSTVKECGAYNNCGGDGANGQCCSGSDFRGTKGTCSSNTGSAHCEGPGTDDCGWDNEEECKSDPGCVWAC